MFSKEKNININITTETLVKAVIIILVSVFLLSFLSYIATPLKLIATAAFLAVALNPAVSWLSARLKSKSRVRATAVSYVFILLFLIGFIVIVVPPLVRQGNDFVRTLPTTVSDFDNQDTPLVRFVKERNLTDEYTQFVSSVKDNLLSAGNRAVDTVSAIGGALISIITVLVLTFMMLVEGPAWLERFWELQPESKLKKRRHVAKRMYEMVTGYVNGQLLIATIAALFALVALLIASTVFDAEINAIALALIVGLIGLIPLIGNTLAAIVVVIVCLFVSIPLAITMAIFFLVYQQIENATLQPYIQSRYNELTPLIVFVAAIIGVSVAGFLGALVAIPIAGCLRVYLTEYHSEKLALRKTKS